MKVFFFFELLLILAMAFFEWIFSVLGCLGWNLLGVATDIPW